MRKKSKTKYDWKKIQQEYDAGASTYDLRNTYGIAQATFQAARIRGDIVLRSKEDATRLRMKLHGATVKFHSEESRKKISLARIKFLEANPDKVPYLINHSSTQSYPEKLFRTALESSGITGWQESYRAGIYEYDFAFPDQKIDVEIDGDTHKTEKVKTIDARRDKWTESQGWSVIRFPTSRIRSDIVSCINELKTALTVV